MHFATVISLKTGDINAVKKPMNFLKRLLILTSPLIPVTVLWLMAGYAPQELVFDRHAIMQGEVWRLITAHFVHCDAEHLVYNILGVLGLVIVFNRLTGKQIWSALLLGIAVVDTWIWFGMNELIYYCGLSALENTLLVIGLYSFWQNDHQKIAVFIGLATLVKISIEVATQGSIFTNIGWPPVPQTHAAGFLAGIVLLLIHPFASYFAKISYTAFILDRYNCTN